MSLRATEGSEVISIFKLENPDCFVASLPRPRNGGARAGLAMTNPNCFTHLWHMFHAFLHAVLVLQNIPLIYREPRGVLPTLRVCFPPPVGLVLSR